MQEVFIVVSVCSDSKNSVNVNIVANSKNRVVSVKMDVEKLVPFNYNLFDILVPKSLSLYLFTFLLRRSGFTLLVDSLPTASLIYNSSGF